VDAARAKSYQPCRMVRRQLHRLVPVLRETSGTEGHSRVSLALSQPSNPDSWLRKARELVAATDRCPEGEIARRVRPFGLRAFRLLEDIGRPTKNPRPRSYMATSRPVARLRTRRGLRPSCRQHRAPVRHAETSRQDNGSSNDGDPGPDAAGRLADALDFRQVVIAFATLGGIRGEASLGLDGGALGSNVGQTRSTASRPSTGGDT
jgi:hypothetical protein